MYGHKQALRHRPGPRLSKYLPPASGVLEAGHWATHQQEKDNMEWGKKTCGQQNTFFDSKMCFVKISIQRN